MNKMICEKCGSEINAESGAVFSVCGNCGANAPLPIEKNVASGEASPKPKTKNLSPAIFATVILTALLMIALAAVGAYWLAYKFPHISGVKPKPRMQSSTSISPAEIIQIEYTESNHRVKYAAHYLTNYTPTDYLDRESNVTFINDGRAEKRFVHREIVNRVRTADRSEKYTGAFAPERFAELARVLVENDFLGEADSRTSTQSPTNQTLTVVYSSTPSRRVKTFQAGNSNSDTPEAEAMLKAFKDLEKKVDWQKEK